MNMTCAVVGTGVIGVGWAVAFAKAGWSVRLYDKADGAAERARFAAGETFRALQSRGGVGVDAEDALSRIGVASSLEEAVVGADYVQESVAESPEVKAAVHMAAGDISETAILASSTSALLPELFFGEVRRPERCIVAHPFNPPYLIPLVELVRAPTTSAETLARASDLLRMIGMSPVLLKKPIAGFVANRLQAAVINEAMHLVAQDVIDPLELDRCMVDGLGLRWAFLGPFATMDLNAPSGVAEYADKFGAAYHQLGLSLGVERPWSEAAIRQVIEARRAALPLDQIAAASQWRDSMVSMLRRARSDGDLP